jgi:hypothetical protein
MNEFLYLALGMGGTLSLIMLLFFYRDIFKDLRAEYLRRKEAHNKYLTDTNELNIEEYEFYAPSIYYKELFTTILLFGLPGINLITFTYLLSLEGYKKIKEFLNSPVLPWR